MNQKTNDILAIKTSFFMSYKLNNIFGGKIMEQMTAKDKGIEFGLQIATGAIGKIDIDRLWDENWNSLDHQKATVTDLMTGFTRKLVYEILGEWADKTISEIDTDEAGQEIIKYLSERFGIEIEAPEEESAEESEPPKLKLVE